MGKSIEMNTPLGCTISGEGPPLVLVHGLFGDRGNLRGLGRTLSASFQVHALDLPNHGESGRLEPGSIEQMATMIGAYIHCLGMPVHYVGHSLGGKVGYAIASRHPFLLASLVVLDIAPVTYQGHDHKDVIAGIKSVSSAQPSTRAEADGLLGEYVSEAGVRQFLLKSFLPERVRQDSGRCWKFQAAVLIASLPLIVQAPLFIEPWQGPALVVNGAQSAYIQGEADEQAIEQWLPSGEREVIENAGHWLHAEQPERVWQALEQFYRRAGVM